VLDRHHPAGAVQDRRDRRADLIGAGDLGVRRPDQLVCRPPEQLGEGGVGAHDLAGQGHRRHPDRGVLEDLAEPLQVLTQHGGVRVVGPDRLLRLVRLDRLDRRRGAQHRDQLVGEGVERAGLLQEHRRAEIEGAVREALLLEAAVHHDAGAGRRLEQPGQRLEAVHHRHRDVEEHQVGSVLAGQLDRLDAVRGLSDHAELAGKAQPGPHQRAHVVGVVHDHDGWERGLPSSLSPGHPENLTQFCTFLQRTKVRQRSATNRPKGWKCPHHDHRGPPRLPVAEAPRPHRGCRGVRGDGRGDAVLGGPAVERLRDGPAAGAVLGPRPALNVQP
jgi:hypothetical protein